MSMVEVRCLLGFGVRRCPVTGVVRVSYRSQVGSLDENVTAPVSGGTNKKTRCGSDVIVMQGKPGVTLIVF